MSRRTVEKHQVSDVGTLYYLSISGYMDRPPRLGDPGTDRVDLRGNRQVLTWLATSAALG